MAKDVGKRFGSDKIRRSAAYNEVAREMRARYIQARKTSRLPCLCLPRLLIPPQIYIRIFPLSDCKSAWRAHHLVKDCTRIFADDRRAFVHVITLAFGNKTIATFITFESNYILYHLRLDNSQPVSHDYFLHQICMKFCYSASCSLN